MTGPPAPVSVLLAELARHGITLRAVGDRLRYRPRSAMTPGLADRLAMCTMDGELSIRDAETVAL